MPKLDKKKYNLAVLHPRLAKEWHPVKNAGLTAYDVKPYSVKKVWWINEKGGEWREAVFKRTTNRKYLNSIGYINKLKQPESNLAVDNPELAKEWHPSKNGKLRPENVRPHSNKKVWWLCKHRHTWVAAITDRNAIKGNKNCPICRRGQRVAPTNCLAARYPDLAREWHPAKNGYLTPEDVTPINTRKVWWQCGHGHEWQASIVVRARGGLCPKCSGTKAKKDNSLAGLFPELAGEWHPTKNGSLTPRDVKPSSNKRVWWRCAHGHEWQADIKVRPKGHGYCRQCKKMKSLEKHNLLIDNPSLAGQWHPTKNGDIKPEHVHIFENLKVWWKCENSHEWIASLAGRNKAARCPYCSKIRASKEYNLLTTYPEIAKELHPTLNGDLKAEELHPGSHQKVFWICKNNHVWRTKVLSRTRLGTGCTICYYTEMKSKSR